MSVSGQNKRIAKNSILLYVRMIVVMAIGLFTSRIVLHALGVEDYGIYNLVGGLVAFFTVINAAMLSATQRFINYGLGNGEQNQLKIIFSTACAIHLVIAAIILILAETIGIWLLTHKLLIPHEKFSVAMLVFQMSMVTVIIQVLTLPYNAVVVAHEKMSVFATISIIQSVLSLGVAIYLLTALDSEQLKLYAILTCCVQIIIALFYFFYCKARFSESRSWVKFNKAIFKEMSAFAGWCMVGCSAGMMYTQGLNILLGMFFLPYVNAARGLAVTVQNAVNQIFNNVQIAVVPQLIQSYARKDFTYFYSLIFKSSKYFSFLLLLVAVPIGIRAPYILRLWLGELPEYVVIFVRILLCVSLVEAVSGPLMRASDATGDIKKYHLVVGGVLMTIVPVAYIFLKLDYPPQSVFYTYLVISILALGARLIILRQKIRLSVRKYATNVILPIFYVTTFALPASYLLSQYISLDFAGLILFVLASTILTATAIYVCGINRNERRFIKDKVSIILHKLHD